MNSDEWHMKPFTFLLILIILYFRITKNRIAVKINYICNAFLLSYTEKKNPI